MNDEHESRHPDRDRLQQLLADRATEGLDPAEWAEIEQLLMSFPDEDPNSWDQAAAWVDVALVEAHERDPEPLPDHLRAGIVAQGRLTVRGRHAAPPRRTSPEPVGAPVDLDRQGTRRRCRDRSLGCTEPDRLVRGSRSHSSS